MLLTARQNRQNPDGDRILYAYIPSEAAAIGVAVAFAVLFFLLLFQTIRSKRSWRYMWPFLLGVAAESVGYGIRQISGKNISNLPLYIISQLMLILAPVSMAATEYILFGKIIQSVGQKYTPIRGRRVTITFLCFDILSFLVQGAGGAIFASPSPSIITPAKTILTIGFLIQICSFGVFLVFAIIYQIRAKRDGVRSGRWDKLLFTLYATCIFILVRSLFRTIEFASGEGVTKGYLLTRESWFYGLEATPILCATLTYVVSSPTRYVPLENHAELIPSSNTEEANSSAIKLDDVDNQPRLESQLQSHSV